MTVWDCKVGYIWGEVRGEGCRAGDGGIIPFHPSTIDPVHNIRQTLNN